MIENDNILVWDRGLFIYLAQKLGQQAKKVWYYMPESSPYPLSNVSQIGEGLDEIERIDDDEVWRCIDKADRIVFPDCYDGAFQHWLSERGYKVFGGMRSEKVEMDKVFFYDYLKKQGLDVPRTYRAQGIDDLVEYLKDKGEKYLKRSYYRGDFETFKFMGMEHLEPWLDMLRRRIGRRVKDIEILVQEPVKSVVEVGYDRFCINGDFTQNGLVGYEIKDKGYVGKVFEDCPEIIAAVDDKMAPLFKKLGYQGHYSNELRITKGGKTYYIDPTIRAPSPPSELMCEMYENYGQAVCDISEGNVPWMEPRAKFGASIILASDWNVQNELCVEFPKDLEPHIKLKNHRKEGDHYYIIPNENDGYFGAVVAWADTLHEATNKCLEIIEEIKCQDIEKDDSLFDKAQEQVDGGEQFGLEF